MARRRPRENACVRACVRVWAACGEVNYNYSFLFGSATVTATPVSPEARILLRRA